MKQKTIKTQNQTKHHGFLQGSFILVLATAMVKVLGAIYRIPLTRLLDTSGMGFYSSAYELYLPMYSIAMAGLPIAISKIVAEHMAAGRYKDVKKTLNVAMKVFLVTGGFGFALMVALAFILTKFNIFNIGALPGILCIAPCLLFCCVMSAYRGYYEGLRNMTPTAISQVLEAIGKLIFGYGLAFIILKITKNISYAAAGALLGITIGTIFSAGYLVIKYKLTNKRLFTAEQLANAPEASNGKQTLKKLVIIAIPIVLGSLVNNVTSLIDVAMVQSQLARAISKAPEFFVNSFSELISAETVINPNFDYIIDLPNSLYGCHRGYAFSIYNLVPVLTSVLGVSAIPVLATAWTKGNKAEVKSNVQTMIKTTAIIAIPAGFGIMALAPNVLSLLYDNTNAIAIAAPNLRILGICAIFAGLNAPLVNMLQAIGKQIVPLKNIAVGAVLKIVVNFILVGTPEINILGVPIGTTVCYAYICIANFYCFVKYSNVFPNLITTIIKPLISGALCGTTALLSAIVLQKLQMSNLVITFVSIVLAVIIYIISLSILKVITKEDVISLPKGTKIAKVLEKLKVIR